MESLAIERLQEIHRLWLEINKDFSAAYCAAFRSNKDMTSYVRSIVFELSNKLGLSAQPDNIFSGLCILQQRDLVPNNARTWKKGDSIWLEANSGWLSSTKTS
jgi:hypothetical protein